MATADDWVVDDGSGPAWDSWLDVALGGEGV